MTLYIEGLGNITASKDALNTIIFLASEARDNLNSKGCDALGRMALEIGDAIYDELVKTGYYKKEGKSMTYMQTRKAVKELILKVGIDGVYNHHINDLTEQGHDAGNISNALNYFRYSPQAAKYR